MKENKSGIGNEWYHAKTPKGNAKAIKEIFLSALCDPFLLCVRQKNLRLSPQAFPWVNNIFKQGRYQNSPVEQIDLNAHRYPLL